MCGTDPIGECELEEAVEDASVLLQKNVLASNSEIIDKDATELVEKLLEDGTEED
jgi:hypothetical protein